MFDSALRRSALALIVLCAVTASGFAGVAAAETRTGGTVTVAAGETVDGLSVVAGTVVVSGTVDGNLEGAAGSIVIAPSGVVTGDVSAAAGSVRIDGRVDGSVDTGTSSVILSADGRIGGDLTAGAESVLIAGEIGGDAVLGAERVTLAQTGSVGGDLRYSPDGQFVDEGGAVGGAVVADSTIGGDGFGVFQFPNTLFTGYVMLVNLVLGAILLAVLPGFSGRVGTTVGEEPLRSAGFGVAALVGIPIGLALLAVTVVGIPLMLAGVFLYALLLWVGLVYGRFAVAVWLLGQFDVDNRWLALVVGIVGLGLLGQLPFVGWLLTLGTFLLGLGAVTSGIVRSLRGRRRGGTPGESHDAGDNERDVSPAGP